MSGGWVWDSDPEVVDWIPLCHASPAPPVLLDESLNGSTPVMSTVTDSTPSDSPTTDPPPSSGSSTALPESPGVGSDGQNVAAPGSGPPAGDSPGSSDVGTVVAYGALRQIFHENDLSGKVSLSDLLPDPDLYAVGALSDLRGEVTIVGGRTYLSYPLGPDSARTTRVRPAGRRPR